MNITPVGNKLFFEISHETRDSEINKKLDEVFSVDSRVLKKNGVYDLVATQDSILNHNENIKGFKTGLAWGIVGLVLSVLALVAAFAVPGLFVPAVLSVEAAFGIAIGGFVATLISGAFSIFGIGHGVETSKIYSLCRDKASKQFTKDLDKFMERVVVNSNKASDKNRLRELVEKKVKDISEVRRYNYEVMQGWKKGKNEYTDQNELRERSTRSFGYIWPLFEHEI